MKDGEEAAAGRLSTETVEDRRARLGADREATRTRSSGRITLAVTIVVSTVLLFFVITAVTGLPGPDAIRRYPLADLQRVADEINSQSARAANERLDNRAPASVDWLRGQVAIDGPLTCHLSFERSDDWEMVEPHTVEVCGY